MQISNSLWEKKAKCSFRTKEYSPACLVNKALFLKQDNSESKICLFLGIRMNRVTLWTDVPVWFVFISTGKPLLLYVSKLYQFSIQHFTISWVNVLVIIQNITPVYDLTRALNDGKMFYSLMVASCLTPCFAEMLNQIFNTITYI